MTTTPVPGRRIISPMGKKKPQSDRHKTARVNVGMPEPWHAVARKLAAKKQQPVTYLLIALLKTEAERQGVNELPLPPWDEEVDGKPKPEGG